MFTGDCLAAEDLPPTILQAEKNLLRIKISQILSIPRSHRFSIFYDKMKKLGLLFITQKYSTAAVSHLFSLHGGCSFSSFLSCPSWFAIGFHAAVLSADFVTISMSAVSLSSAVFSPFLQTLVFQFRSYGPFEVWPASFVSCALDFLRFVFLSVSCRFPKFLWIIWVSIVGFSFSALAIVFSYA